MSLFGKLFGRRAEASDFVEPQVEKASRNDARDEFFATLKAQQNARQEAVLFDDADSMTQEERMKIAHDLVKSVPRANIKVVNEDGSEDGLVSVQDSAATGSAYTENDGRNADIWSTFAMINPRILKHFVSRAFIGYPACTVLGTHEIINPCCAMPGEDAMAPGYKLNCTSDEHDQNDEHIMMEEDWLKKVKEYADDTGLNKTCTDYAFFTRLYGIGVAIPRVKLKGEHTMEEPYNPDFIVPGSFKGFSVVDPQKFSWDLTDATLYDPLSDFYMKPEFLHLFNRDESHIHRSWCIISFFKEVGDDLKGTYMWGGVPLSQMLYERVFCADKLANEIVALAMSKRTVVKDGNMKAMIADPNKTNHFIKRWNGYRNNQAIAFKEPGEQIQQLETSLADLQPLSAQQYQYAAAIAGIPVTKLLKNVPSGLQATGQYEQDEYEQTLKGIQETYYKPLLMRFYEMYLKSNYPERHDLSIGVEFNPIQLPKASEVQQMAQGRASMVCSLLMQNAITITEARAILKSGDSPLFDTISSDTPDLLLKIEKLRDPEEQQKLQAKMQQMQMGGGMGAPGGQPNGGANGQLSPEQNQKFQQNKDVFQEALREVMGDEDGDDGGGDNQSANEGEQDGDEGQEQDEGEQSANENMDTHQS